MIYGSIGGSGSGRLCIEGTLIRKTGTHRCLLAFEGGGDLLRVSERFLVIHRSHHPQTRFELTIQKFIGVQFRRICGKEKAFDFFRMSFAPGSYQLGVVNSAVVADDEELSALSAVVLDQTMQAASSATSTGKPLERFLRPGLKTTPGLEEIIRAKAKLLKHSADAIADALLPLQPEHRRILKIKKNQIDVLEARCHEWFELLTEMQQPFQECIDRLMSIPHLKEISARLIFAEIGPGLSSFTSCEKFCSWAGVCPGVKESAGKRLKGVRSGKGNQWLKYVLVELCSGIEP